MAWRLVFLRICSAVLVKTNGWQRSFHPSLKARILVLRSLTGPKLPRYASKRWPQLDAVTPAPRWAIGGYDAGVSSWRAGTAEGQSDLTWSHLTRRT